MLSFQKSSCDLLVWGLQLSKAKRNLASSFVYVNFKGIAFANGSQLVIASN